jgi:hypothetical protein
MTQKRKRPARSRYCGGAKGIAVDNAADIAQTGAAANSPTTIIAIRRGPGGKAAWLVTVKGGCLDGGCDNTPFRDRDLRGYHRFCIAMLLRFSIRFDQLMPQGVWQSYMLKLKQAKGRAS